MVLTTVIENAEELVSHSIRANHEVLSEVEIAKEAMELITDVSADLIGIVTEDGLVIRGNLALARLLGVDHEDIHGVNLSAFFLEKTWGIILNHLKSNSFASKNAIVIEIPLDKQHPGKVFHWTFTPFHLMSGRRGNVFTFVAKDVSTLRDYESKLSAAFKSIPLGIFTINRLGCIEGPYSTYTEILLQDTNLGGKKAESIIMKIAGDQLTPLQKQGFHLLFYHIGREEGQYDAVRHAFPSEIACRQTQHEGVITWLGLTFNPIVHSGIVEKVIVIVEDISDRVSKRTS